MMAVSHPVNAKANDEAMSGERQVLALQAFIPDAASRDISNLCIGSLEYSKEADVAFRWGAVPHVTVSAWQVMKATGFDFEDFDNRSGDKWWPHLTLFGVPEEAEKDVQPVLEKLAAIPSFRLSALALVGFERGIHTLVVSDLE